MLAGDTPKPKTHAAETPQSKPQNLKTVTHKTENPQDQTEPQHHPKIQKTRSVAHAKPQTKYTANRPCHPRRKRPYLQKMELSGTKNFNAYARKMLIDGYVVKVDTGYFQELAHEVNKIGTNINQLARVANTTGTITNNDISRVQELVNELWQLLKSSLSALLSKGQ